MYTIKEVAKRLCISTNAIRFYEKQGLIRPQRNENNYRSYDLNDITRLEAIILYRKMGFSLEGIKKLLGDTQNDNILHLFASQYELLNRHIHIMERMRECVGGGIELLLDADTGEKGFLNTLEKSVEILNKYEKWEDNWAFDNWAESYDQDIRKHTEGLDFYRNYDLVLERTAKAVQGSTVAEIGIGTGNLAKIILSQGMNAQNYIGIDQSVNMLKEARKKCPDISLKIGTFLELPLADHSCDTLVSSYAFHHCNESEKLHAFEEMDRVLNRNGTIVIADLMFANAQERVRFAAQATKAKLRDLEDEYFGNVDKMENILETMGYYCESVQVDELIWILVAKRGCQNMSNDFCS